MYTEFHDLDQFRAHLATQRSLQNVVCQRLDLRGLSELLRAVPVEGAVFLGCQIESAALADLSERSAVIFPRLPNLPYQPYRAQLYTPEELLQGYRAGQANSYFADTLDGAIYRHYMQHRTSNAPPPMLETLAQRLHDHAIDDALYELLRHHPQVAAIMGGHAMRRGEPAYRDVAWIARALTRAGLVIATGGGPGAMEAANLGAYLAEHNDEALEAAITELASAPDYRDQHFVDVAFAVRQRFNSSSVSLSVPTWFYGHEPSNLFASFIAKYFANSLREEGLLAIANRGIVFAPGSAGTVQEIFMEATQNHYGVFHFVSPMVFLGRHYWQETLPALPLLRQLAGTRQYAQLIASFDDPQQIVDYILATAPIVYAPV
jgi:predicted Rossmann-fold nucleotide-binding protein